MATFETAYSVNTVLHMMNQLAGKMQKPLPINTATTINDKRNIQPTLEPNGMPAMKYFGIGVQGFYNVDDGVLGQPHRPLETNMDIYTPIPIRIMPYANDLTEEERAQYRMRSVEQINGVDYVMYWLKLLEFPSTDIDVEHVNLLTGERSDFVFDPSHLTPTPNRDVGVDIVTDVENKVEVSAEAIARVSGLEVAEAINILYAGDFRWARISEFGYYTGEDRVVSGNASDGGTFDYTESIYTQLATHRCSTGDTLSTDESEIVNKIKWGNSSFII